VLHVVSLFVSHNKDFHGDRDTHGCSYGYGRAWFVSDVAMQNAKSDRPDML
jgi:hypothetical protein